MEFEGLVVVVDLERDSGPVEIEDAEIMLPVRVVGVAKVVEDCDGLDKTLDCVGS